MEWPLNLAGSTNRGTAVSLAISVIMLALFISVIDDSEVSNNASPTDIPLAKNNAAKKPITDVEAHKTRPELVIEDSLDKETTPAKRADQKLDNSVTTTPLDVYNEYIEAAEDGFAEAQFIVSRALNQCGFLIARFNSEDQEALRKIIGDEALKSILSKHKKCRPLGELVGTANINALEKEWLQKAAEQGYALAKINNLIHLRIAHLTDETNAFPAQSDMVAVLHQAFADSKGNNLLEVEAYWAALVFSSEYYNEARYFERDAWYLIWCKKSNSCDYPDTLNWSSDRYRDHDVEALIERGEEIERAIDEEDWYTLAFDQ